MTRRSIALAARALAALFAGAGMMPAVLACGVCVEDKMAATYDNGVVQRAAALKRLVVFVDVRGVVGLEQLRRAAGSVRGVQRDTIRASLQPMAVSFALDPAVQTPERAVSELEKALGIPTEVRLIRTLGGL